MSPHLTYIQPVSDSSDLKYPKEVTIPIDSEKVFISKGKSEKKNNRSVFTAFIRKFGENALTLALSFFLGVRKRRIEPSLGVVETPKEGSIRPSLDTNVNAVNR